MKFPERLPKSIKRIEINLKLAKVRKGAASKREASRKLVKRYFRLIR